MKIKSIVPYFGGKRTLAPIIVQELGKHASYWEPFCGGMSVLLAKPETSHEHVNDLHGDLINLARVIQHPRDGAKLYRRLRRTLCHETLHSEAKESLPHATDCVDRAYFYFVMSWFGRNGVSGTKNCNQTFAVRWTPHGGHGGKRFGSAVESIPAWRRRMRRVVILNRDAFGVVDSIADVDGVAIYVDPPYIKKGGEYEHDFSPDDHVRLAEALRRFDRARVVCSYYDHPQLADLYPQWTIRRLSATKNLACSNARGSRRKDAPEVLLLNGPSYDAADSLFSDLPRRDRPRDPHRHVRSCLQRRIHPQTLRDDF